MAKKVTRKKKATPRRAAASPLSLLCGVWEMQKLESWEHDAPTPDHAKSGMFVFTRDRRLSVVSGSHHNVMAYCGSFEVKGDQLMIKTESCNVREREGTSMVRKIVKLTPKLLVLEASNPKRGMRARIYWKKKISF